MSVFKLTKEQRKHYASVKWLLGEGPCGTGKTTLMALVFIEKALSNLDNRIYVFDHHQSGNTGYTIHYLFSTISDMFLSLGLDDRYNITFYKSDRSIKITILEVLDVK